MPFEPTPAENFEFDPDTGLIAAYIGTDVDVVVPREINGVTPLTRAMTIQIPL